MNHGLFVCPCSGKLSDLILLLSPPTLQENCIEFLLLESYFSLDILNFGQVVVVLVVLLLVVLEMVVIVVVVRVVVARME